MKDMVEPASVQDEGIQLQWRPRYLNGTISSCAADSSEQAEVERLSNTFCSGSHWTLGKLPTHFEPGSIQTARKASTMTNLLGKNWNNFVASYRQTLRLNDLPIGLKDKIYLSGRPRLVSIELSIVLLL